MNNALIERRCKNCNWLLFKATTGTTRIECKCNNCKTINIVGDIETPVTIPMIRRVAVKRA